MTLIWDKCAGHADVREEKKKGELKTYKIVHIFIVSLTRVHSL